MLTVAAMNVPRYKRFARGISRGLLQRERQSMLDLEFIRSNPAVVREAIAAKGVLCDLDALLELDNERRRVISEVEQRRASRNRLSRELAQLDGESRELARKASRDNNKELVTLEKRLSEVEAAVRSILYLVPSIPLAEVPRGRSEAENVEVRRWGQPSNFGFKPRDHVELATLLGLADFDRPRSFAGPRSYALRGDGVLLHNAVLQLALGIVRKKGFTPVFPPVMVREAALLGTGFFPLGYEDTYSLTADDLFLTGTSEVALIAMHSGEILERESLPIRYVGWSDCFRREAGAAGRDTRGLYRVHMFQKVEQVSIGPADPNWSRTEHSLLLNNSEELLQALGLPYRVMLACTGELGQGQVLKHEVETWMPSRKSYSETHSCSSLHDFQSRRSNIRYRDGGKLYFTYTLNNTAVASPRILIPILENFQNEDGSVTVPEVLRPYLDGRERVAPPR
jgi:seryl-tRNA synthetase